MTDLGIERGLTVVMDPLLDDYLYTIIPIMGWKASKNGITCYLISRESKSVISSNLPFREQFHSRGKMKSDIKEKLFIVHAKLKSGKSFFFFN